MGTLRLVLRSRNRGMMASPSRSQFPGFGRLEQEDHTLKIRTILAERLRPAKFFCRGASRDVPPARRRSRGLLEHQEHEYLAPSLVEWLQSLANERPGSVNRHAPDVDRGRSHGVPLRGAGHQEVADGHGPIARVDPNPDSTAVGDLGLAV